MRGRLFGLLQDHRDGQRELTPSRADDLGLGPAAAERTEDGERGRQEGGHAAGGWRRLFSPIPLFYFLIYMGPDTCQEFEKLKDGETIYKLVGPVLLKQEKFEADSTVKGRLDFIDKEM